MVIRRPFPGLTPTLWGEPDRYASDYWEKIHGVYYTGDEPLPRPEEFFVPSGAIIGA